MLIRVLLAMYIALMVSFTAYKVVRMEQRLVYICTKLADAAIHKIEEKR